MHVEDFCANVLRIIDSPIRNEDFNITGRNPYSTLEIIDIIEDITGSSLDNIVKWHPETDYLGNHRLSDEKYTELIHYHNGRGLREGIRQSWESIKNAETSYNPLKHLEEAKEKEINLKDFFPK